MSPVKFDQSTDGVRIRRNNPIFMKPERPIHATRHDRWSVMVTDDDSRTLIDPATDVAFHSGCGAVAETRHVYLNNSCVADRLAAGIATAVLEIGLGTGLAMLMTVDDAIVGDAPLRYIAIENAWLSADVLSELKMAKSLRNPTLADRYCQWRESLVTNIETGDYVWRVSDRHEVTVRIADARAINFDPPETFDAIYFDPFAPDVNGELWTTEYLSKMFALLRPEGRLVTYCVKSAIRRAFDEAGFEVTRLPGPPGGKREVMYATTRT